MNAPPPSALPDHPLAAPLLGEPGPAQRRAMAKAITWRPLPGHIPYVLDFRAGRITAASR